MSALHIVLRSRLCSACATQVGFFATRDIEPGEELTYLRSDIEPSPSNSDRNCNCGQPMCSLRI